MKNHQRFHLQTPTEMDCIMKIYACFENTQGNRDQAFQCLIRVIMNLSKKSAPVLTSGLQMALYLYLHYTEIIPLELSGRNAE